MFKCLKCHNARFATINHVVRDDGDWVLVCSRCEAKNILAPVLIGNISFPAPELKVIGWREADKDSSNIRQE